MKRISKISLVVSAIFTSLAFRLLLSSQSPSARDDSTPQRIVGISTNGLQPTISIQQLGGDWTIEIDYVTQSNFAKYTWLKVTNREGAKLQLWLTNGQAILSSNASVRAAMSLPYQTTVSNVMDGVRSSRRGDQWFRTVVDGSSKAGLSYTASVFTLGEAFGTSISNDCILHITPLMYRVNSNMTTATLLEFPPIKVKLLTNGIVQSIRD
jgi:hypothetical protein